MMMMSKVNVFLMIFTLVIMANGFVGGGKITRRRQFIQTIPERDRNDFLGSELLHAVHRFNRTDVIWKFEQKDMDKLSNFQMKFKNVIVPQGFSRNLLHWIESEAKVGKAQIKAKAAKTSKWIQRKICFPAGCVDVGDIGSICCPF